MAWFEPLKKAFQCDMGLSKTKMRANLWQRVGATSLKKEGEGRRFFGIKAELEGFVRLLFRFFFPFFGALANPKAPLGIILRKQKAF